MTYLHVTARLGSGLAARVLMRVLPADRASGGSRHIVVVLTEGGARADALRNAGVEVHCLGHARSWHAPRTLLRLAGLMRRIQPDATMTWSNAAHVMTTMAAVANGTGTNRLVWNLLGSSPKSDGQSRRGSVPRLLARLSPLPAAIATDSPAFMKAYKAQGFRPRRWLLVYSGARGASIEAILWSHRRAWSAASPPSIGLLGRCLPRLKRERLAEIRRAFLPRTTFVAVTGSCGKSSTVRLAVSVLRADGSCYCREFRNDRAASASAVLSVAAYSKYCVQEVSGHGPGVIAKNLPILRHQIAIVTTVGTDHYTNFHDIEATAEEKGGLVEALPKHGVAILNADDPRVRAMAARTRARVLLFGVSPDADVRATEVSSAWPDRLSLTVVYGSERVRIHTQLVGDHWTTSVLAAIACGLANGIDLKSCADALEAIEPMHGRCSVHTTPGGPVYVLDVKSSYWTITTSLTFLADARAPRKTAVFGTLSDIPGRGNRKYRQVAKQALEVADRVIFMGPSSDAVQKLRREPDLRDRLFSFPTAYQGSAFLAAEAKPDELILIKASIRDHLERAILSQHENIVCWQEQCGNKNTTCSYCRLFRRPHAPPLGLPESLAAAPTSANNAGAERKTLTRSPS